MSGSKITIRRAYVRECERFWQNAPVRWTHNNVNNSRTLATVSEAKNYIDRISKIWEISGTKSGQMFINTLNVNCEQIGTSASEYLSAQYMPGSQEGICKYILVVIYSNGGQITLCHSYHDITENMIGSDSVYTKYAEEITLHWLKEKAVESIRGTLPSHALPQIAYE